MPQYQTTETANSNLHTIATENTEKHQKSNKLRKQLKNNLKQKNIRHGNHAKRLITHT